METDNSSNNNKRKLLILALCAIVVIIGIGTSVVVYTLAQSGNNNGMSSKLNLDKIIYNTTSSWEEHNTTTSLRGDAFHPNKEITLFAENADIEFEKDTKVPTWIFNGTVSAPTLRFTEGENINIHFINKGTNNHTIHFHGTHDDKHDRVIEVKANGTYNYNITAEPASILQHDSFYNS